nr:MAG TPA: Protein of unknown function (DUF3139) [Caudoviricetes sp.]
MKKSKIHSFLILILVMVGGLTINAQSKYIITKTEDELTYRGFDENDIPETDYTWNIEDMGGFYLTAYRLVGVWKNNEGEITNIRYQDMYSGLIMSSSDLPNDELRELLNNFWGQYEVGDIVKIPSLKWDYEDFTPGQSTLYQGGYYGIKFTQIIY